MLHVFKMILSIVDKCLLHKHYFDKMLLAQCATARRGLEPGTSGFNWYIVNFSSVMCRKSLREIGFLKISQADEKSGYLFKVVCLQEGRLSRH